MTIIKVGPTVCHIYHYAPILRLRLQRGFIVRSGCRLRDRIWLASRRQVTSRVTKIKCSLQACGSIWRRFWPRMPHRKQLHDGLEGCPMSGDRQQPLPVSVIGAGCAGLSLAARAADLPGHRLSLIAPKQDDADDHIWGFGRWSGCNQRHQPRVNNGPIGRLSAMTSMFCITRHGTLLCHSPPSLVTRLPRQGKASGVEFRYDLVPQASAEQTLANKR